MLGSAGNREDKKPNDFNKKQVPISQWVWLYQMSFSPPSGTSLREASVGHFEVGPLHGVLEKGVSEPCETGYLF